MLKDDRMIENTSGLKLQVICGNNIEVLKQFPDNYFDAVVTDAPYGLGKEPKAEEVMRDWVEKGFHEISGSGFMGKEWDAFVPQPLFWKEVYRVLKHGGHVLSFFGTRTYDWGVMAMRFAGFEVRDCIQWLYGSGFPKSHNVAKTIEAKILFDDASGRSQKKLKGEKVDAGHHLHKISYEQGKESKDYSVESRKKVINVEFQTESAKQWDGWGSALKPANEPIVLARKPLEKGLSIAENVLKWGTGGINIDGCRVGNEIRTMPIFSKDTKKDQTTFNLNSNIQHHREETSQGRFPANLILTHHPDCICNGLKKVKAISGGTGDKSMGGMGKNGIYGEYALDKLGSNAGGLGDENGEETIEDWTCHEDCPIKIMDEQSGLLKSGIPMGEKNASHGFGGGYGKIPVTGFGDSGGASRFFYVAKASKSERNFGLEGFEEKPLAFINQAKAELKRGNEKFDGGEAKGHGNSIRHLKNFHPTVKPVKLMQYLVRLVTPPNGIVLDPFSGSGTTGIACKLEGINFVGIDITEEYCKIAESRIKNFVSEEEQLKMLDNEPQNPNQLSLF